MRITVIPIDGVISINNIAYHNIDLSFIDASVNAIQWYDTEGEIERKDSRGRIISNEKITSFDEYSKVVELWEIAKREEEMNILNMQSSAPIMMNS